MLPIHTLDTYQVIVRFKRDACYLIVLDCIAHMF